MLWFTRTSWKAVTLSSMSALWIWKAKPLTNSVLGAEAIEFGLSKTPVGGKKTPLKIFNPLISYVTMFGSVLKREEREWFPKEVVIVLIWIPCGVWTCSAVLCFQRLCVCCSLFLVHLSSLVCTLNTWWTCTRDLKCHLMQSPHPLPGHSVLWSMAVMKHSSLCVSTFLGYLRWNDWASVEGQVVGDKDFG